MVKKISYPCPCGGKLKWKKEKVVQQGINCGVLDTEVCEKCGDVYLPDESMQVVEDKLKEAGLWGVDRKEIKFWKNGGSVSIRFPAELVRTTGLDKVKKGFVVREGKRKLIIEF